MDECKAPNTTILNQASENEKIFAENLTRLWGLIELIQKKTWLFQPLQSATSAPWVEAMESGDVTLKNINRRTIKDNKAFGRAIDELGYVAENL